MHNPNSSQMASLPEKAAAERWSSRWTFVIASIGSAVGFGNVWRFPYLVHKHGATFLVPYFASLLIVGIPILILEYAVGQFLQQPCVEAFISLHPRWRGIGWAGSISNYVIAIYYNVLVAWSLIYFILSFKKDMPWQHDANAFFHDTLLHETESIGDTGSVVSHVVLGLGVMWMVMWVGLTSGAKSIGTLNDITMTLPTFLLGILFFRAVTLEGADVGVRELFRPKVSEMFDPNLWSAAFGQIFYSLGVGSGVMITYSSFNEPNHKHIVTNSLLVSLANSLFSLVAAVTMFSFIGHVAETEGIPFEDVVSKGPGLTFEVFPQVMLQLPGSNFLTACFFGMLVCLGISSAVAIIEPLAASLAFMMPRRKIVVRVMKFHVVLSLNREMVVLVLCIVGFLSGLLLCTGSGPHWLELLDDSLPRFAPLLCGVAECVAVATTIGCMRLIRKIEYVSKITHLSGYLFHAWTWGIPCVLSLLLLAEFVDLCRNGFEGFPPWAVALGTIIALGSAAPIPAIAIFGNHNVSRKNNMDPRELQEMDDDLFGPEEPDHPRAASNIRGKMSHVTS